jgi:hypothetical protein
MASMRTPIGSGDPDISKLCSGHLHTCSGYNLPIVANKVSSGVYFGKVESSENELLLNNESTSIVILIRGFIAQMM